MTILVARGFTHIQSVPSTTWTIDHGRYDHLDPRLRRTVEVFVDIAGERVKMIPKSVAFTPTSVTITFSVAQTGEAYVV